MTTPTPHPALAVAEMSGRGGLPKLVLTAGDGARAELYLHGAHVTSWVPAGGAERLFVSEQSGYQAETAIRGGIPVIFPQFGPGPLMKHGFARTSAWELVAAVGAPDGAARAVLTLRDSDLTRLVWPHAFGAELAVELLGATLTVSLGITNPGAAPLAFTGALHTYLRVGDIGAVAVEGLTGVRYRDQAGGGRELVDQAPALVFGGEVDRLYVGAPSPLVVRDGSGTATGGASDTAGRAVEVRVDGFPDAVVWNPWAEKARLLADMADDEYRRMVCVEAAVAARPAVVAPGERWTGVQRLTALRGGA